MITSLVFPFSGFAVPPSGYISCMVHYHGPFANPLFLHGMYLKKSFLLFIIAVPQPTSLYCHGYWMAFLFPTCISHLWAWLTFISVYFSVHHKLLALRCCCLYNWFIYVLSNCCGCFCLSYFHVCIFYFINICNV